MSGAPNDRGLPPALQLALVLMVGAGGSAGYQALVPPRPDPFTGTAAAQLAEDLRREMERLPKDLRREWKLDIRQTEYELRTTRPPPQTRARILALESAVKDLMDAQGQEWSPPTMQFAQQK